MFVNIFKSNFQILIFILFIFGALIWIYSFFYPAELPIPKESELLYFPLYYFFLKLPSYVLTLLAFTLLFIQSLVLNNLIINFSLTEKNTFLPGLIYFVLMSIFPSFCTLNQVLIINLIVILCLNTLFNLYLKEETYAPVFNISFVFSSLSLLYLPASIYLIFLWFVFIIYRLFKWREWVISIIGFLLPYLFVWFYFFWNDKLDDLNMYFNIFKVNIININFRSIKFITMFFVQLLILYSGFKYRIFTKDKIVMQRKLASIFITLFIISIMPIFFISDTPLYHISTTFLPASVFLSYLLLRIKKNWISELIFFTLLGLIIVSRIYKF